MTERWRWTLQETVNVKSVSGGREDWRDYTLTGMERGMEMSWGAGRIRDITWVGLRVVCSALPLDDLICRILQAGVFFKQPDSSSDPIGEAGMMSHDPGSRLHRLTWDRRNEDSTWVCFLLLCLWINSRYKINTNWYTQKYVFTIPGTISQGMLGKMAAFWMWAALADGWKIKLSSQCFTLSPSSWWFLSYSLIMCLISRVLSQLSHSNSICEYVRWNWAAVWSLGASEGRFFFCISSRLDALKNIEANTCYKNFRGDNLDFFFFKVKLFHEFK